MGVFDHAVWGGSREKRGPHLNECDLFRRGLERPDRDRVFEPFPQAMQHRQAHQHLRPNSTSARKLPAREAPLCVVFDSATFGEIGVGAYVAFLGQMRNIARKSVAPKGADTVKLCIQRTCHIKAVVGLCCVFDVVV